jgi:type IV pilus assembly protein PilA
MKNLKHMKQAGFTLVELMVVVAIIGILASLAIPQYSRFQARARQSEARIQLGAIKTVEGAWFGDRSSFTVCLGEIGYARETGRNYYAVGFGHTVNGTGCGPDGGSICSSWNWVPGTAQASAADPCTQNFAANSSEGGGVAVVDANSTLSQNAFSARATGQIRNGALTNDVWSVDQTGAITNTNSGI